MIVHYQIYMKTVKWGKFFATLKSTTFFSKTTTSSYCICSNTNSFFRRNCVRALAHIHTHTHRHTHRNGLTQIYNSFQSVHVSDTDEFGIKINKK